MKNTLTHLPLPHQYILEGAVQAVGVEEALEGISG